MEGRGLSEAAEGRTGVRGGKAGGGAEPLSPGGWGRGKRRRSVGGGGVWSAGAGRGLRGVAEPGRAGRPGGGARAG